ncbi:MAG: hypothetical protein QHC67_11270 [Sphingobium sp.]|uniref:hypothetical protein n=1 Tax=Sphingobium sp. TaxID=1912891 RepID=UPI0029B887E5|nr:hypothetical protein [Sphingobium sp.]MDX3910388.1 hypothetical protein [Sphingobium sp.]
MIKTAWAAAFILIATSSAAGAKKVPEMSPMQIQELQSRTVEVTKTIAFSAVMSVLQDSGYRIGSADRDTGLITGLASTNTKMTWMPFIGFGSSKKTPVVSAFIEDLSPTSTKIRLNFVMTKNRANGMGAGQDEEPILDAAVYRDAFEKVDQAIFIRTSAQAPSAPAPVPVAAAVQTTAASAEASVLPASTTASQPN